MEPTKFLTVFNMRGIVINTSILALLGVGMTFVIITGGIDLSVGSVLVFAGVVADKTMAGMGGQGWGAVVVGLLVAIACGTRLGHGQRRAHRSREGASADRHAGHARHGTRAGAGHHRAASTCATCRRCW